MGKINLLPHELSPDKNLFKLAEILTRVSYVALVLFVLAASGLVAVFVYDTVSLQSLQKNITTLKNTIKSMEASEQKYVLIKDRIDKAQPVLAKNAKLVISFNNLTQVLAITDETRLVEAIIEADGGKLSFRIQSPESLTKFLSGLSSGKYYKKVEMTSFSLNQKEGYSLSFDVKNE